MATNSKIEWTTHTFNPWRGCSKVSDGCANCYAEALSGRNHGTLGVWGPNGTRVVAAEAQWKLPLKWDREAAWWCEACKSHCFGVIGTCRGCGSTCRKPLGSERPRVFCASLADVFENWAGPMVDAKGERLYYPNNSWEDRRPWIPASECGGDDEKPITMDDVRKRLFSLIDKTPNLDWLVLTKRPENIARMLPWARSGEVRMEPAQRKNIWIGTSVENQKTADKRVPHLLEIPAAVRFLSCEPLLGPVDLWQSMRGRFAGAGGSAQTSIRNGIDWVIVGGESGPKARPFRPEWILSIVKQCEGAGVPCFVKQMGSNIVTRNDGESGWPSPDVEHDIHGFREEYQGADCRIRLMSSKGGNPEEWPEDLRVREFPR